MDFFDTGRSIEDMVFEDAMARARALPVAAVPYYLAVIEPFCDNLNPRIRINLTDTLGVTIPPAADCLARWVAAVMVGDTFKADAIAAWLTTETGLPAAAALEAAKEAGRTMLLIKSYLIALQGYAKASEVVTWH